MLNPIDLERLGALRREETERRMARQQLLAQLPPTTPAWERATRARLARVLLTLATALAPGAVLARPAGNVAPCTC
ncbi:MAG TPA: hypothetical protein VFU78_03195 [Thermomicrobiales bacterium]|nr:hypothetical protein [Thermomicrobiales bacterium]